MRSTTRYTNKLLLLVAFLGSVTAAVLSISFPVHVGTQAQTGSVTDELQNAKAKLDQAIAEKKKTPSKTMALAVERALSEYNAVIVTQADNIRESVKVLEAKIGLLNTGDTNTVAHTITNSEWQVLSELQMLKEALNALRPTSLSVVGAFPPETEPNNSPTQATQIQFNGSTASVSGAITPVGDVDYFKFAAQAGKCLCKCFSV